MEAARLFATVAVAGANTAASILRGFGGQVNSTQKGISRMGQGAGNVAMGFARLGAAAAGAAAGGLGLMAKVSIDFEDAFANVKKTVNETDLTKAGLSFESLRQTFLKMSTEMPVSASELATIGEAAGALGVKAQDIAGFTDIVAKLGVTTNLSSAEAANSLGKVGTILGLTGQKYNAFADTLVNLGNQGASTEAEIIEITKRFAAAGKQAGLTTNDILALSSAAASLGLEPEAAGGALSRVFSNMASDIALANDNGKAFADVMGRSLKDLTGDVREGKGLELYLDFLRQLGKMDRVDAAKALVGVGITDTRNRDAVLKMAQNLGFVNDQLAIAKTSTGALETEATKKFDTVKAKVTELKNTFIKAGIDAGDGFLPALGRMSVKAKDFVNSHTEDFKQFGRDVGQALDDVDWTKVADSAEKVVDVGKGILDIVRKIPPEVAAIGAAFVGVNNITGGLFVGGAGNLLGGLKDLAGGLIRASGAGGGGKGAAGALGRALAQPVYIVGVAPGVALGGLGGSLGAPGGPGGGDGILRSALKWFILPAVGLAVAEGFVAGNQADEARRAAGQAPFYGTGNAPAKFGGASAGAAGRAIPVIVTGLLDRGGRELGGESGKQKDDRVNLAQLLRGTNAYLSDGFRQLIAGLKGSKKPEDVTKFARDLAAAIDKGGGNVATTSTSLTALRAALKATDDPETRQVLKDAIARVERRLIGREWVQRQLDKADGILKSSESTKEKISDLTAIQRTLRDRGDTHAAASIGQKIDEEKRHLANEQREAKRAIAFAIRDQELSVTVKPQPVYINLNGKQIGSGVLDSQQFTRNPAGASDPS